MLKYTIILSTIGYLVLHFFPQIDLMISHYFYNESTQSFFYVGNIRLIFLYFSYLVPLIALILLIYSCFIQTKLGQKAYAYTFTFMLLGPGIITNAILKSYWGRARPKHITEFGGSLDFSPVSIMPTDQCATNCSFVSGEASGAFAMILLFITLFARTNVQKTIIILIFAPMALLRIVHGAHFFSDVYFAAMFMILVNIGLIKLFKLKTGSHNTQDLFTDCMSVIKLPFRLINDLYTRISRMFF